MAVETIELNAGSGGSFVAVDRVSSADYQLVKIAAGGDGNAAFAATPVSYISAGTSDDATNVKSTAGVVYSLEVSNTNASARYIKLYNKSSAPAVASDTPIFRFAIPGQGGIALSWPHGKLFSSGIGFVLVTGPTDTDGVDVAANEIMVNLSYV